MRRPIALILLASSLSGCMRIGTKSWRVQPPPPADVVTDQHPKRIRVLRADTTKIVLRNPSIIGDSLVAVDAANRRYAMALTQVMQVEVEKTDGGKVALGVVAGVGGTVLLAYLLYDLITGPARGY